MAARKRTSKNFQNIDDIVNFVTNSDSENDVYVGSDDEIESDWETDSNNSLIDDNDTTKNKQQELDFESSDDIELQTENMQPEPFEESHENEPEQELREPPKSEEDPVEEVNNSPVSSTRTDSDSEEDVPLANVAGERRGISIGRVARGRARGSPRVRGGRANAVGQGRGGQRGRPRGRRQAPRARAAGRRRRGGRQNQNAVNPNRPAPVAWKSIAEDEFINLKNFPFLGNEGLKGRVQGETPLDYASLYLTDEFWQLLVAETNRYADQFFETNVVNTNTVHWVPVDVDEMKSFVGLLLLMGIVHKPTLPDYWSLDDLIYTPVFSQVMKRNRFYLILRFLHFNDNTALNLNHDNPDRLHKIRPLINLFRERCYAVYSPGQNLSIDESLVLFKGRLKFRQYIKTKRARFGVKFYELCTSDGITLDFLIYCGKGMFHEDDPYQEMCATERIPAVLMDAFLGIGHILFTDNWYTSPTLAKFFLGNSTHLVGTVRSNRINFPTELNDINLEKGKAAFMMQEVDPMVVVKYRATKDKANKRPKIVHVLSTFHQPVMERVGAAANQEAEVFKPISIKAYNQHMGGVDRVDQQLHSLQALRKAYKWYRKVAVRLITQMILNSQKIYVHQTGSKMSFLDFTLEVVRGLITKVEHIVDNHPANEDVARLLGRHFLTTKKPSSEDATNKHPTKICKVCYAQGKRSTSGHPLRTTYVCGDCQSEPGLHLECNKIYHTVLDYKNMNA